MTEQLHFHFLVESWDSTRDCIILSFLQLCVCSHTENVKEDFCKGEGNGNLPQYSCMENPRDRGAWWAAIYGVAQSRTQLKQLSSSRYLSIHLCIFMSFMAYRGSSQLKDRTQVSHIAGGFFTIWATREALTRKSLFYPNLYYILVSCTHTILL